MRIGDRRIDGVPLFDAGLTGTEGVTGRLGPLGSEADIALVESEPARLDNTEPARRDQVDEARRAASKGVVVLTRGTKTGLFLNANRFTAPSGPPTLQISGSDLGAPRQPNLIHASDDELERWGVAAMGKEGIAVNAEARYDAIARGETGTVQRLGARFFTVACASDGYHSPTDR